MHIQFISVSVLLMIMGQCYPQPAANRNYSRGEVLHDARDGEEYQTVWIGDQCWMAENLNYGTAGEIQCYQNNPQNCESYGGLYTWEESLGACPSGWHLPSKTEWEEVARFLGVEEAGQKLKAAPEDPLPWDGTNESGFTALPAGAGNGEGFHRMGDWALYWSSTEYNPQRAWFAQLDGFWYEQPPRYKNLYVGNYYLKSNLFSVRCVKDNDQGEQVPGHPPNILCIVCEDISPFLGCYGDPVAKTPRIDHLAAEGVRYSRMYSVSGVCAPSRNALITGMYPGSIGGNNMRTTNKRRVENVADSLQIGPYECTPPPYVRCYTEYLREAGYYCTNNSKEDYQFTAPRSAWDESSSRAHWRNRPGGMPFFSIFNLMRSHESQIWAWEQEPWIIHPDSVEVPPYLPDTPPVRRDIARMHSNNAIMDREVGELIDQLEADGLLDSTIIIFYSDHGGPLPRGKREILETGTRVPFIIRFPGNKDAGTVVDDLCSFVDIPATILSLAGVRIPGTMHGQAFLGGQKAEPRGYVFGARDRMDEWFDCRRAVRDMRFRYIRNYRPDLGAYMDLDFRRNMNSMQELLRLRDEGKLNGEQMYWFREEKQEEELYDLEMDPFELNNLASDPAYGEELERLRNVLDDWIIRIDDRGVKFRTEKELMLDMWPGGNQPVTEAPEFHFRDRRVEVTCGTEGASLAYQVNHRGLNPGHWFLYHQPVYLEPGDSLTVIAHRIGFRESIEAEFICPHLR